MVLTRKYVLIHRKTYFIAQVILFVVQKDVNAVPNIILYALVLFVVQKALHWFAAFIVVILKHLAVVRNVATFSKHAVVFKTCCGIGNCCDTTETCNQATKECVKAVALEDKNINR